MDAKTGATSSRERILQAAKHLFAVRGYENTSTIMIAREAGTSESQMVKHFGSKDGLLEAIFEQGWASLGDLVQLSPQTGSGADRLKSLMHKVWQGLERDPEVMELMLLESRRIRKHGQLVLVTRSFIEFTQRVDALLISMSERGELRAGLGPAVVRSALLGMGEGLLRDQLLARRLGAEVGYNADDMIKVLDVMLAAFLEPEAPTATATSA
jgi:AcrR family transcriptional regulator